MVCKTPGDGPGKKESKQIPFTFIEQVHVDTKINHENTGKTKPPDVMLYTLGWRN